MTMFSPWFLIFTAVLLPLYFVVPRRGQWGLLLLFSVVFYAAAGWQSLLVLMLLTAVTYVFGRLLGRVTDKRRRWLLFFGVVCQLLPLALCKLAPVAGGPISTRMLPLGLSYVTLSAVSYLADVARGQLACERNALRLALFLFYFPQMWQGPINRYGELSTELFAPHAFDGERAVSGGLRALWGCVKKLVIADTAAIAVTAILQSPAAFGGTGVLLLIVLYSVQIYGDFTGGMDIALGLSHVMGIAMYENFDRPFGAASPGEYWRRWHRSMGRFFTDYVFYPLSTGRLCQGLFRLLRRVIGARVGGAVVLWTATLATWALTGLWHGAGWNFVVWGLCNALAMLLWQGVRGCLRRRGWRSSAGQRALGCGLTFCTVGLFRTLDIYRSVPLTRSLWGQAMTPRAYIGLFDTELWDSLGLDLPRAALVAVGVLAMLAVSRLTPRVGTAGVRMSTRLARRPYLCALLAAAGIAAVLVLGNYGLGFDAMDFIYGQY